MLKGSSSRMRRWIAGLLFLGVAIAVSSLYFRHLIAERFIRELLYDRGYTVETLSVDRFSDTAAGLTNLRIHDIHGITVNAASLDFSYQLVPLALGKFRATQIEIAWGETRVVLSGVVFDPVAAEIGSGGILGIERLSVRLAKFDQGSRWRIPASGPAQTAFTPPFERVKINRAELLVDAVVSASARDISLRMAATGVKIDRVEIDSVDLRTLGSDLPEFGAKKGKTDVSVPLKSLSLKRISIDPTSLGLPLITAHSVLAMDSDGLNISIDKLATSVFGGEVELNDGRYSLTEGSGRFPLSVRGLDVGKVLESYPSPSIHATGRVDGTTLIELLGNKPWVSTGEFLAVAPGGVIRYQGSSENVTDARLRNVYEALQHFNYTEMQGTLATAKDGALEVKIAIKGVNPDMEASRPIHMNLAVEENLEALLKTWKVWNLFR